MQRVERECQHQVNHKVSSCVNTVTGARNQFELIQIIKAQKMRFIDTANFVPHRTMASQYSDYQGRMVVSPYVYRDGTKTRWGLQ